MKLFPITRRKENTSGRIKTKKDKKRDEMDPIGTTASVLAFASCAVKIIQTARSFHCDQSEVEFERHALERYTVQLRECAARLPAPFDHVTTAPGMGTEYYYQDMVSDCREIAGKLLRQLDRISTGKRKKKNRSWVSSFKAAVLAVWTKDEMDNTLARLNTYTLRLSAVMTADIK